MDCGFLWYIKQICGFWKHSWSWICCEFWSGLRIVSVLVFESWVQNKVWFIELSSALEWVHPNYFSFEPSSFKLKWETVSGIALCYSHQACCLLYYLHEIINAIHMYPFTFEILRLFLDAADWQINRSSEKKAQTGRFAYHPYSPPPPPHH